MNSDKPAIQKYCTQLQSEDRFTRKNALEYILAEAKNNDLTDAEREKLYADIYQHVLKCFRDKAEVCRELSSRIILTMLLKLKLNDFYLTYVFPALVERIGDPELVEESEEMRLNLLQFMRAIIQRYSKREQLVPFLNDIIQILRQSLADKYPKIKQESCECICDLAEALPNHFHMQCESLIEPALKLFTHQQSKVRVAAVNSMCAVILNSSSGTALEKTIGPLAERLFDQNALVRRAVIEATGKLLTVYRDRYSYFANILPLILTGLHDEYPETREFSGSVWKTAGEQFLKENEKDMKEQIDFALPPVENYPKYIERPDLGCRALVLRSLGRIVKALSKELEDWMPDIRLRCSQLLCSVIIHTEENFTQYLQDILPAMFKACRDPDKRIVENLRHAGELIGVFVPVETWLKLIQPVFEDETHYGHLMILSAIVRGCMEKNLIEHLETICSALYSKDVCFKRKSIYQEYLLECCTSLLNVCNCRNVSRYVYIILFSIMSLGENEADPNRKATIEANLKVLAKQNNLDNVYSLHCKHVPELLEFIDDNPTAWLVATPERCVFENILLCTQSAVGENLERITRILTEILSSEADAEAKLKIFNALSIVLYHKNITLNCTEVNISKFLSTLVNSIFVPSLIWHAGRTAETIRTIAASCLKSALKPTESISIFTEKADIKELTEQLLPSVLSLAEDAPHLSRSLALEIIAEMKMVAMRGNCLERDTIIKMYPVVLKRLDDPAESVRFDAVATLETIFLELPPEWFTDAGGVHIDCVVDCLIVHFDDNDEKFRHLVGRVLKLVAILDKKTVVQKLERAKSLICNKEACEELLNNI